MKRPSSSIKQSNIVTGYDNATVYNVQLSRLSVTSLSTRLKAPFMNASPPSSSS